VLLAPTGNLREGDRQNERAANVVWQWQPQGQVVVYPQPYATTKPLIAEVPPLTALAGR